MLRDGEESNNAQETNGAENAQVPATKKWYKNPVPWLLLGIVLFFVGYNAYFPVPAGHVGVRDRQGHVPAAVMLSGPHLKIPFWEKVITFDTRLQVYKYHYSGATLKTKTGVRITKFEANVSFHLVGENAAFLYRNVGPGTAFVTKVLEPVLNGAIFQTLGKYDPSYLIMNQETVRNGIKQIIKDEIDSTWVAEIDGMQLTGFMFDSKIEQANVDLAAAKIEAERILTDARARAADLHMQCDSIDNPLYIEYLIAKARGLWNGDVPSTLMMGNEALAVVPGGKK